MKTVFLDTNIILDIVDSERENHEHAKNLLRKTIKEDSTVVISEDMLSTVYYIVKNKKAVLSFFQTIIQQWHVVAFGQKVISSAINYCLNNEGADFEDALQCFCAIENKCDLLISHDRNFIDCGIKVSSIKLFLHYEV